jgi:POLO box duplicated region
MRWVDNSGKYGLAYQLSNSLAGMYFIDSTSILLCSDGVSFDYLDDNGLITHANIDSNVELQKKIHIAVRYKEYMTNRLHGIESKTNCTTIFLAGFRRASKSVLFRMSDDTFQVISLVIITNLDEFSRSLKSCTMGSRKGSEIC